MRALAVVMALVCFSAQATPADAPTVVQAGFVVPKEGIYIPTVTAIKKAEEIRACEAEVVRLKSGDVSVAVLVAVSAGAALVAGLGLGFYLGHGSQPSPAGP